MDEGHKIPFRGVWDLCCGLIDKEVWFEEGLIFVIVGSLIRIRWTRQFVRWGVDLSGNMLDDEVIFLEVGVPSCCSSVQLLWGFPIL